MRAGWTALGRRNIAVCHRGGLRWELDLREGIDLHIFLFGTFESEIVNIAHQVVPESGTVIDIGANIGAHALRFAAMVGDRGSVYAFEPTDYAFAKLSRNIGLNPNIAPRIHAMQVLLLASAGQEKPHAVYASWPLASASDVQNVHEVHFGALKPLEGAQVSTLDQMAQQLGLAKVDLVKLDVDGNELFVLQGGRQILRTHRPFIVMECAPYLYPEFGYSMDDLCEYLQGLGYHCQLLPARERVEFTQLATIAGKDGSVNVLLVPE